MKTLLFLLCFLASVLPSQAFLIPHSGFVISRSMDSATILQAVEDYLQPLLAAEKGLLTVAETEEDAIELLANSPERWRVILTMDGDEAREDLNPAGLVVGTLVAWVQTPKGMEAKPGKGIHRSGTNGSPSFMTRLHWVIRKLRALGFEHEQIACQGLEYKGWNWLRFEDTAAFRTARARFEIVFAHDDPTTDPGALATIAPGFAITGLDGEEFYIVSRNGVPDGKIARFAL